MTNKETVEYARKLALCDEVLNREIRWWHRRQGSLPLGDRGKPFIEWLDWTIEYLSYQIDRWYDVPKEIPPAEDLVCALRVNAEGDFLALYQEKKAKSCCMTDVNCYVEEGVVYSNIWLRSDYADLTYDKAREIAEQFKKVGYSATLLFSVFMQDIVPHFSEYIKAASEYIKTASAFWPLLAMSR